MDCDSCADESTCESCRTTLCLEDGAKCKTCIYGIPIPEIETCECPPEKYFADNQCLGKKFIFISL